jgi:co-chaperonin GroES (HSP10)
MRINTVTTTFENAMIEAFPAVNAGIQPFGSRVLIQIRTPKKVSRGGIILDTGTQDTEKWNTQVGKVISLGPLAFKNRNDMTPWPEGDWCTVGEFVRVAKYGGDRWEVKVPDSDESAMFVIFNDLDIIGQVTGDPLAIRAFI